MVRVQEAVSSNLAAPTKLKITGSQVTAGFRIFIFTNHFLKLKFCFFFYRIALYAQGNADYY